MYKGKNGLITYETFDELLQSDVVFMTEYEGKYYIKRPAEDIYDNSIWVVDKKTEKVSFMFLTDYFGIMDKATPIDPKTLRRVS